MKTKLILLFVLIGLIFLAACEEKEPAVPAGTGLVVEFIPISILEDNIYTIYEEEEFPLEIIIKNKGSHDIAPGDITLELLGPSKEDFSGLSWEEKNKEALEKTSEFNPAGGEETITFAEKAKYKKEISNFVDFTWNVNYQYKYQTDLVINDVCFKEDLQDPRVCTVDESKTFSVSQAPITVASVEETSAGKGVIALLIEVKNALDGDFTVEGEEFDTRFNQLDFKIDEPGKWECKGSPGGENKVKIYQGSDTASIRCKLKEKLKEGELYTSPIKLTFNYIYQDLAKETLRIKESAE